MSSPRRASARPAVVGAVVIAHGPTGTTLTALNRTRDLIGADADLVVVAGAEPGLTAVERAVERGYDTVSSPESGTLETGPKDASTNRFDALTRPRPRPSQLQACGPAHGWLPTSWLRPPSQATWPTSLST